MITVYYALTFAISLLLTLFYVYKWRVHFEVNITIIFTLIPVANLGYLFEYSARTKEAYINATKVVYIGGAFLLFFINMCVFRLSGIHVKRWVRTLAFLVCCTLYSCVLSIGYSDIFYRDLEFRRENGRIIVSKDYGPAHLMFYVLIAVYFLAGLLAIVYSYRRKKQVSKWILRILLIPEVITILGYVGLKFGHQNIDLVPATYVIAQIIYLVIVRRMSLYNISSNVIDTMVQTGDTGFVSLDFRRHYLGSNETANRIIPALSRLRVDEPLTGKSDFEETINRWIEHFKQEGKRVSFNFTLHDPENEEESRVYQVEVNYLYDGLLKRGYQLFFRDDTENQKYINLLDKFNSELEEEVEQKTARIVEMHDNLIMSMAVVVESRDNSTGGHVRRTSEGVRILVEEMRKDDRFMLTNKFCKDIAKAAPMHDLGKIAVDDDILKKPGRFTPEEFEQMKRHAAEGARIVHEILKDTDDEEFKVLAENVAHYHHERWDGSGYPEGLKGEEIPLEARIMAIADVYDALVSKRVYKESLSFEKANEIIIGGMGSQFDERLMPYYVKARPKLEAYYTGQKDE